MSLTSFSDKYSIFLGDSRMESSVQQNLGDRAPPVKAHSVARFWQSFRLESGIQEGMGSMGKIRQEREARLHFNRWMDLQKDLQDRLEFSLRRRLGPESKALLRYRNRYFETLPSWTGRILSPAQLTRRLARADAVLLGDFHSLAQSQRTALRLLKRLVREGCRPAIGLEMVAAARQSTMDAFLSGGMEDGEFLEVFRESWDFPYKPVHTLLNFARYHALSVFGLNSDPPKAGDALRSRDREAAKILMRFRAKHPDQPLFVLMGDFHLGEGGLPRALAREGFEGRLVRCFQNPAPLYWESLDRLGESPEILDLEGGDVAIQSATPIVKLQSYHYWITGLQLDQDTVGDAPPEDPVALLPDLSEEVDALLRRMARFLRIPLQEESPAAMLWIGQEDFPKMARSLEDWSAEEINLVAASLAHGQGCYLPERNLGFLAKLTQNRIAEMAGRILLARSARVASRPRTLVDDFYLRVVETALTFLASKIINPLRKYRGIPKLRQMLERNGPGRNGWRSRAQRHLDYLEAEDRYLREGDETVLAGRFFRLSAHEHLDLTRAVGKHLGGRLYDAMMSGKADRFWLRDLFFDRMALEGAPTRAYFEILERLRDDDRWLGERTAKEKL